MNRICIEIATNKLIEFQEGDAELGALRQNAINAGYLDADIDELYTPLSAGEAILTYESPADTTARLKREADTIQRAQDMIDNLPDWQGVSDTVDAITDLASAKVFIKKLARVTYWLAKSTSD